MEDTRKKWKITCDGVEFTNYDIRANGVTIKSSLCSSQDLKFGSCESTQFEVTLTNTGFAFGGKRIELTCTHNGNTIKYPPFDIVNDSLNADRSSRTIKGYDDMHYIINKDVTDWYNDLTFPMTLKQFRDSFFEYIGVEQVTTALINDDMTVKKMASYDTVTGKQVVTSICEVNASFGHINCDGKFDYIVIEARIKPSLTLFPSETLFPGSIEGGISYGKTYKSMSYEDYEVKQVVGVKVIGDEGATFEYGNMSNYYTITENILLSGKTQTEINAVSERFLSNASGAIFVPCKLVVPSSLELAVGNVIDAMHRNGTLVTTVVLNVTTSGAQAVFDTVSTEANEYQKENVNSIKNTVSNLSNRTATTERVLDNVVADNVTIHGSLSAQSGRIGTLEADNVTIHGTLTAQDARIGNIEADYINTQKLNAHTIDADKITSGTIDAARISASTFGGRVMSAGGVNAGSITCSTFNVDLLNKTLKPMQVTIGGAQYVILAAQI